MGYFHDANGQTTEAYTEYKRLEVEKRDLQDMLTLIYLRQEVKQLRNQVELRERQGDPSTKGN